MQLIKTNQLIIGLGEIGEALRKVLKCDGFDLKLDDKKKEKILKNKYDILHICIPYSENFKGIVEKYQNIFKPKYTVIHSTVPIGTSDSLNAIHSPVRGKHPKMVSGIKTFVKYFGGKGAREVSKYFSGLGISVKIVKNARDTEAMKLWDNTQYGWNIMLEKIIWKFCKENNLDFNIVYTDANRTYNLGYEKLKMPQFKKYILKHIEGKIGGHCVVNNLDLFDNNLAKLIKEFNRDL